MHTQDRPTGYGCASSQQADGTIHGQFGSAAFDFTTLRIQDPAAVPPGNLCDGCLVVLVETGALIVLPAAPTTGTAFSPDDVDILEAIDLFINDTPPSGTDTPP